MSRYLIALIIFLACLHALGEPYRVFEENGKVGLKNEEGKVLLPATFEALGWSDGSFSVIGQITGYKLGDRWGIINLKKEFITKAEFESIQYSGGDRIITFKKIGPTTSRFGCLNLSGKITVPFKYDGIRIQGLRAIVFIKNGSQFMHGLIDLEDKQIIPLKFRNIYPIGSLRYAVENFEPKTALFTDQGMKLTNFVIDSISSFHKGKAVIYQDLKQGLVNLEGEIKIEPHYREIRIDTQGVISARVFDEWKILDGENSEVNKISCDELSPLAQDFYRITLSRKKGVLDDSLNPVIDPVYDDLSDFHFGKVIAKRKNKFGLVHIDGSEILPFLFDSIVWDGTFIRAKENGVALKGWNLYDTFGVKKTSRVYDHLGAYNGKFFPVGSKRYHGAINRYGEEFIHCVYDSILEFKQDQLAVKFQAQYGIISLNEDWLVTPQQHPIRLLNGEKYLEIQPHLTFLKDFAGETIYFTDNRFEIRLDHLLEFLPDGTEKMVSLNGQIISRTLNESTDSEKISRATEGLQGIKRDGLYGFVDDHGRLRIANRYEDIGVFKEGLAPVKILGKWGFVNTHDNIAINPDYQAAEEFEQGLAIVKKNGKTGVINTDGKTILPMRYDSVKRLTARKFLIISNAKQGLSDASGNILFEPQFDKVEDLQNGYVLVERENKFGLLTLDGLSTIPLAYDTLVYDKEENQYLAQRKAVWVYPILK